MLSQPSNYHTIGYPFWSCHNTNYMNPADGRLPSAEAAAAEEISRQAAAYPQGWSHLVPASMPWMNPSDCPQMMMASSSSSSTAAASADPMVRMSPNVIQFGIATPESSPPPQSPQVTSQITAAAQLPLPNIYQVPPNTPIKRRFSDEDSSSSSSLLISDEESNGADDESRLMNRSRRKLLATEENVARRLRSMSLKVGTPSMIECPGLLDRGAKGFGDLSDLNDEDIQLEEEEEERKEKGQEANNMNPKLVISTELESALKSTDVMQKILVMESEKASRALVLWTPPTNIVPKMTSTGTQDPDDDEKEGEVDEDLANQNQSDSMEIG